jgi:membrane associated rhomboid family serine protease
MRPAAVGFHCPDDVHLARKTVRAARTPVGARLHDAPYVTTALIVANVVVYIVSGVQNGSFAQPGLSIPHRSLFEQWQLFIPRIHDGQYYRLITSAFLHVSLLHIASNMIALAIVGPPLERLMGMRRFAATYLLGALGGSALVYAFGNVTTPEVGASGAIFGLFGACLVAARKLGLDLQWLIGIIVLNFVFTFSVHNISKLGHIGGFVAGGLAALAIIGPPGRRSRLSTPIQAAGIAVVAAFVLVVVAVRTATFS